MTILFIISLIGLFLFLSWKIFEDKTGKKIISTETFSKSDNFIYNEVDNLEKHYKNLSARAIDTPALLNKLSKKTLDTASNQKNKIADKIIRSIDEKRNIERNKGSVSLFLRSISKDKGKS